MIERLIKGIFYAYVEPLIPIILFLATMFAAIILIGAIVLIIINDDMSIGMKVGGIIAILFIISIVIALFILAYIILGTIFSTIAFVFFIFLFITISNNW